MDPTMPMAGGQDQAGMGAQPQITPQVLQMLQALHGSDPQAGMANAAEQQASLGNQPMPQMPPGMYGPMMGGPPQMTPPPTSPY